MRRRGITVAHSAATALLAGALGACGSGDSSGAADAAATDGAAPEAPAKDSAVVSSDVAVQPGVDATAALD
ncbi:MAG: hypothetical protein M3O36_03605, partial [Myxococcota bacterium]|nr:hypothetical protein [Myxococcota bacterium]